MDFAKSALFKTSIGVALYQVLFVFYSYPNDDTEMATFDLTVPLHTLPMYG